MFRSRNIVILAVLVAAVFFYTAVSKAQQDALAIFNLTPTNMEAMGYDGEILYALISVLEREKTIELMPRREMEERLFQAGLVQGGDLESIVKAGKTLGINFVLFGNVTKKAGRILATLKLMDVQQKRLIKTWDKRFAGRDSILEQMPAFARELSSTIINGEQSYAVPAAAPTQPAIDIENLIAKSQGTKVVLTWKSDPAKPIAAFNVYRSEHLNGPYQYHGKTEAQTFNDTNIKKGRSYYYRLGILLKSGKEVKSRFTTEVKSVGEKIPYPPLILNGDGYVRRIEIKFVPSLLNEQENFKIQAYKIYRKKSTQDAWEALSSVSARTEYQSELGFTVKDKTGLEDGETYIYAVSSIDRQKRESQLSDPVSVKTVKRPILSVAKDGLLRKIDVAWEPQTGVEGYYLYRKQDRQDWQKVARLKSAPKSRYTDDKGLEDGQLYQYYLTAYDAEGESGPSEIVQAMTKNLPPHPQDVIAQSGMVKSVKIFWTSVDDPDIGGYLIFRGTNAEELKEVAKVKGYKSHSFMDKGAGYESLKDGQSYYYAIVSYNLFGADGEPTKAVKATTKPRPGPVKNLMTIKGSDHIQLKWAKNPEYDIETYILSRNRNNGFWSEIKRLVSDQTSFKDNDLRPETDYRYRIIVRDKDGLESDPVESEVVLSPIEKPKK